MTFLESWSGRKALKHVQETYGFLFERGYAVVSGGTIEMGWQVVLRKGDLFIRIEQVREEDELYFRKGAPPPDKFTDSGSVIYAATGDDLPRWESSTPKVLQQYLDRIETYFDGEYVRNPDSLRAAEEEHYKQDYARFEDTLRAAQELHDAAVAQAGAVPPSAPKATPLLHYPLIVIILLLILGGLITLCAVLVERLFAAF